MVRSKQLNSSCSHGVQQMSLYFPQNFKIFCQYIVCDHLELRVIIKVKTSCDLIRFSLKLGSMSLLHVHGSVSFSAAALQLQIKSKLSRLQGTLVWRKGFKARMVSQFWKELNLIAVAVSPHLETISSSALYSPMTISFLFFTCLLFPVSTCQTLNSKLSFLLPEFSESPLVLSEFIDCPYFCNRIYHIIMQLIIWALGFKNCVIISLCICSV